MVVEALLQIRMENMERGLSGMQQLKGKDSTGRAGGAHLNVERSEKCLQRPQKDFPSSPSQNEWSFLPEMPLHLPSLLEVSSFCPSRPLAHLGNRQSGAR